MRARSKIWHAWLFIYPHVRESKTLDGSRFDIYPLQMDRSRRFKRARGVVGCLSLRPPVDRQSTPRANEPTERRRNRREKCLRKPCPSLCSMKTANGASTTTRRRTTRDAGVDARDVRNSKRCAVPRSSVSTPRAMARRVDAGETRAFEWRGIRFGFWWRFGWRRAVAKGRARRRSSGWMRAEPLELRKR